LPITHNQITYSSFKKFAQHLSRQHVETATRQKNMRAEKKEAQRVADLEALKARAGLGRPQTPETPGTAAADKLCNRCAVAEPAEFPAPRDKSGANADEDRRQLLGWLQGTLRRKRVGSSRLMGLMDDNRSGSATYNEFANGLAGVDIDLVREEYMRLFRAVDDSGDRSVSMEELRAKLYEDKIVLAKPAASASAVGVGGGRGVGTADSFETPSRCPRCVERKRNHARNQNMKQQHQLEQHHNHGGGGHHRPHTSQGLSRSGLLQSPTQSSLRRKMVRHAVRSPFNGYRPVPNAFRIESLDKHLKDRGKTQSTCGHCVKKNAQFARFRADHPNSGLHATLAPIVKTSQLSLKDTTLMRSETGVLSPLEVASRISARKAERAKRAAMKEPELAWFCRHPHVGEDKGDHVTCRILYRWFGGHDTELDKAEEQFEHDLEEAHDIHEHHGGMLAGRSSMASGSSLLASTRAARGQHEFVSEHEAAHMDKLDPLGGTKRASRFNLKGRRSSSAVDMLKLADTKAEENATPWRAFAKEGKIVEVSRICFLQTMARVNLIRDKNDTSHLQKLFSAFDLESMHVIDAVDFCEQVYVHVHKTKRATEHRYVVFQQRCTWSVCVWTCVRSGGVENGGGDVWCGRQCRS